MKNDNHNPTPSAAPSLELLTTADLMRLLKVSKNTVSRWVVSGKIKAHRLDGSRRCYFIKHEIEDALQLPHLPHLP